MKKYIFVLKITTTLAKKPRVNLSTTYTKKKYELTIDYLMVSSLHYINIVDYIV